MWKGDQKSMFLKNIVKEIVNSPVAKGENISHDVALHILQFVQLDPEYTQGHDKLSRESIETVIDRCLEIITTSSADILDTIKLQVRYRTSDISREEATTLYSKSILKNASSLYQEILNVTECFDGQFDKLYQQISKLILLLSDMGSPANVDVVEESTVALGSIFKPSKLPEFVKQIKRDKEEELQHLTQLVVGIRLYNRSIQKGGCGIENIPYVLKQTINRAISKLNTEIENIETEIFIQTSALIQGMSLHAVSAYTIGQELSKRAIESVTSTRRALVGNIDFPKKAVNRLKDTLISLHLKVILMKRLFVKIQACEERTEREIASLNNLLQYLRKVINFRSVIPISEVFPPFTKVALSWRSLQEELFIMKKVTGVLQLLAESNTESVIDVAKSRSRSVCRDSLVNNFAIDVIPNLALSEDPECVLSFPSESASIGSMNLDLEGFCIVALVEWDGVLVKGNPFGGICEWDGKRFCFHCLDALCLFRHNPRCYFMKMLHLTRKRIEFLDLLNVRPFLRAVEDEKNLIASCVQIKLMKHITIQTELHPVQSNNEKQKTHWEHLERAMQLAKVSQCQTKTAQTDTSSFRAHIGTQASPDKDEASQTNRDGSSNVPVLRNFIFGLRGSADDKHAVFQFPRAEYK